MAKISEKNMAEAIYMATQGKTGADLKAVSSRILAVLENKRMLGKSDEVLRALQNIFDRKSRTVRMKVISAKKLANTEKHELTQEVKKRYKAGEVVSEFFEREELLGGMRVEVGEEVLDTTYRSRLNSLGKFLRKEK